MRKEDHKEISITNIHSSETTVGQHTIRREALTLNGTEVWLTRVIPGNNSAMRLIYDQNFTSRRIIREPGGILIDNTATANEWGKSVGRTPEQFLSDSPFGTTAVMPSHFGWQDGSYYIDHGSIIKLIDDKYLSLGPVTTDMIYYKNGTWSAGPVEVNPLDETKMAHVDLGFSMPLILKDNRVVPIDQLLSSPRLLADLRNVFKFNFDYPVPNRFWEYFRKFIPPTFTAATRLYSGRTIVERRPGEVLTPDQQQEFQDIIVNSPLSQHLKLEREKRGENSILRLVINGHLPLQQAPLLGIAIDVNRRLQIFAVDGRQKVPGLTVNEFAQLMKYKGMISGGLGSAGGDVSVVSKTTTGFEVHNSPSTTNSEGQRVTRPAPAELLIN